MKIIFLVVVKLLFLHQAQGMTVFEEGVKKTMRFVFQKSNIFTNNLKQYHSDLCNLPEKTNFSYKKLSYLHTHNFSAQQMVGDIRFFNNAKKYNYFYLLAILGTAGFIIHKDKISLFSEAQNPENLKDMILKGYDKAQAAKDKDVVFVIGNTGAGKSTTIAYLMGAAIKPEVTEDGKPVAIIDGDNTGYPIIGHTFQSETLYSQVYQLQEGMFLCDCPGFFDNRSLNERIAISINMELAIRSARSRKVIVLASYDELIAQRGESFKNVISLLERLFKDPEHMASSVLWAITKAPPQLTSEHILKSIHGNRGLIQYGAGQLQRLTNSLSSIKKGNINIEVVINNNSHGVINQGQTNKKEEEMELKKSEEKMESLRQQGKILASIKENNLVLIDPYNTNSRKEVLSRLRHSGFLSAQQFRFDQDEPRIKFRNLLFNVADEGIRLLEDRLRILQEKEDSLKKIIDLNKNIEVCENSEKDQLDAQNRLLGQYESEFQKAKHKKNRINEDKKDLKTVLDKLNTDEEVILYSEEFKGTRGFWSCVKKEFSYKGDPFNSVKFTKEKEDKIVSENTKPQEGFYQAKYEGCSSTPSAKLEIFVKQKDRRDNKLLIEQTNNELKQNEKSIDEIENTIIDLDTQIKTLNRSQINAEKFAQEKRFLIKQKETINENLKKKETLLLEIENKIKEKKPMFVFMHDVLSVIPFPFESALMQKFNKVIDQLYK